MSPAVTLLCLAALLGGAYLLHRHLRSPGVLNGRGGRMPLPEHVSHGDGQSLDERTTACRRVEEQSLGQSAQPAATGHAHVSLAASAEAERASTKDGSSDGKPTIFAGLLGEVRDFLERCLPASSDTDLDNRREVYAHIADFLGERLDCPPAAARNAAHRLCDEQDEKTLLAGEEPCDDSLLEQARCLVQEIQVQYLLADSRQARRITTIIFLAGDRPAERRVTDTLHWDLLPHTVRDEHVRHGARQMTFQLYP